MPLKLKGRRKRIVERWVGDPGTDLVPTDVRDPTGSRVLASWGSLTWKECAEGVMLFFDDKTNDEDKMAAVWDFQFRSGETLEDGNDKFTATVARTSLSADEFQVRRAYNNLHDDVDHVSGISINTRLRLIVKTPAGNTLAKLIQVAEDTQDARGSTKPSR